MIITTGCGTQVYPTAIAPAQIPTNPSPTVPEPTITPIQSVSATSTPRAIRPSNTLGNLVQRYPAFIGTSDLAIAYSFNLLVLLGYEEGFQYDNAVYTSIVFPDGSKGAFVAMGFSGITRGYKILYKTHQDEFRIVQLSQDPEDWGINWGKELGRAQEKVDLKFPELIRSQDGTSERVIELSGADHMGTGLWTNGYFEILRIDDDGFKVIFSGNKLTANYNSDPSENQSIFEYRDLDGDGNKEIIKEGQDCGVTFNQQLNSWSHTRCRPIHEIYKYNGDTYVKQP